MYYRRKIDTASFIKHAPLDPGWRILEDGESVRLHDQKLSADGLRWQDGWAPNLVAGYERDGIFRRKIEVKPASTKTPLGLCPEYVWASNRAADILAAMTRYVDAGEKMPSEWLIELDNRLHEAKLVELTEDK